MSTAKNIAKLLLEVQAVTLSPEAPYTWASGLRSPIYCDNRLTISYPEVRKLITKDLVELIKKEFPEVEAIVGTATAGIPQACWVADSLELPLAYVRSSNKEHGKTNLIEGVIKENSKVVVIEDLISTGGSSIVACQALEAAGLQVLGVAAIFTYEMNKAVQNFTEANIKYQTLSGFSTLIQEAIALNYVSEADLENLLLWSKDPIAYTELGQFAVEP